jgi:hypothetical protein
MMRDRRAEGLAGTVAAAIYNGNGFRGKDSPVIQPSDFFPSLKAARREARAQTLDEQIAVLTAIMGCGPDKN